MSFIVPQRAASSVAGADAGLAEQGLLGAILARNDRLDRIPELRAEHFAFALHARIFRAIVDRFGRGHVADGITLAPTLEDDPDLPHGMTGRAYLAALLAAATHPANLPTYADTITDAWRRREAARIGLEMAARAGAPEEEGIDIASDAAAELLALAEAGSSNAGVSISEAARQAMRAAEEAARNGGRPPGLSTGLAGLDRLTGGLSPGQMIVLGGRPGMGKTAAALNIVLAAGQVGAGCVFFSLEMGADELADRLLCRLANIPHDHLRDGRMNDAEAERLVAAERALSTLPIWIDATPGLTAEQIHLRARGYARKLRCPLGLVVIDHIGLMSAPRGMANAGLVAITEMNSKAIKRLAKELKVPVLAAAQLKRDLEHREDKRPTMADLRWSGSIEQDADVIVFLHREEAFRKGREPQRRSDESASAYAARLAEHRTMMAEIGGRGELIIVKQRRGATGTIPICFDGATYHVTDDDEALR